MQTFRFDHIPGPFLVSHTVFHDKRGLFLEKYKDSLLKEMGVEGFVQVNHSRSKPKVIRGLHYQHSPEQGKFVSVIKGDIWDVILDLRVGSPSFGTYLGWPLNESISMWVPPGFAHGFCVLGSEPADVVYSVTATWNQDGESGIRWNTPYAAKDKDGQIVEVDPEVMIKPIMGSCVLPKGAQVNRDPVKVGPLIRYWPVDDPIVSGKDAELPSLADYMRSPVFKYDAA